MCSLSTTFGQKTIILTEKTHNSFILYWLSSAFPSVAWDCFCCSMFPWFTLFLPDFFRLVIEKIYRRSKSNRNHKHFSASSPMIPFPSSSIALFLSIVLRINFSIACMFSVSSFWYLIWKVGSVFTYFATAESMIFCGWSSKLLRPSFSRTSALTIVNKGNFENSRQSFYITSSSCIFLTAIRTLGFVSEISIPWSSSSLKESLISESLSSS